MKQVLKQLQNSISLLPLSSSNGIVFNILVYLRKSTMIPCEWNEVNAAIMANSSTMAIKSFDDANIQISTCNVYRICNSEM